MTNPLHHSQLWPKSVHIALICLFLILQSACQTTTIQTTTIKSPDQVVVPESLPTISKPTPIPLPEKKLVVTSNAPAAPREFRAAWVATVSNIDWPSSPNLSSAQQQEEVIAILDRAKEIHLNAIILQVRPSADAIYPSELEPWTEYLTGEQNRPPSPWYDPLQFWIEQAHLRGLELHAWFNPYRAKTALSKTKLSNQHIGVRHPDAVKQYGDLLWMDPSHPLAAQQTLDVITDVVRRYDVDGIHIDDYFYPYPVKLANGKEQDFPDDKNWAIYQKTGGNLSRANWRRDQVNELVGKIYHAIHQEKSWVKFGISPFGIGRPDRLPAGIAGFSQYDKLYADVELWLSNGWLDYLAPQLYWPIDQTAQAFRVLDNYWINQNPKGRHIWPGLFTSRIDNTEKSWSAEEILNQVSVTREFGNAGHIHFSMAALLQNRKNISQRLNGELYLQPALVPATPWLEASPVLAPSYTLSDDQQSMYIDFKNSENVHLIAIWKRFQTTWVFSVQSSREKTILLKNDEQPGIPDEIVVTLLNRAGQESPPIIFKR